MKTCLISPPTNCGFGELARTSAVRSLAEHAPLGILNLAAVLEQLGMTSQVLPLSRLYYEHLARPERSLGPDFCRFAAERAVCSEAGLFGLGTICSSYPLTLRVAAELRRLRPDAVIVLGGPQASVVAEETMDAFSCIDVVVRGEAEETLPKLIQALSGTGRMEDVEGITFRAGGRIIRNTDAPLIQDLDPLPLPAFDQFLVPGDFEDLPLEIGRGCPFSCTFCSTNDFFRRRFRLKSSGRIIGQMIELQKAYKVQCFDLVHDMFTVDRKKVLEFCAALMASRIAFSWKCSARTDCVDEQLLETMAEAGCRSIFFGIETGSPRLQKSIDKGLDLQYAARMIDVAQQNGINTTVSLITGFPEETFEDLAHTVDFFMKAARHEQSNTQLHLLAPLAKTPIHLQYRERLNPPHFSPGICTLGWEQSPADQELIRSKPAIFANFYSLPVQLGRSYLEELRTFLLSGIFHFRWLMQGIHEEEKRGIISVFERWKRWQAKLSPNPDAKTATEYYFSAGYIRDFLFFLQAEYLPVESGYHSVRTLLKHELKWRDEAEKLHQDFQSDKSEPAPVHEDVCSLNAHSIPVLAKGVGLLLVEADALRIINRLRAQSSDKAARNLSAEEFLCLCTRDGKHVDVLQLTPLSGRLLALCDGRSHLEEICSRFACATELEGKLETFDPREACIFGLTTLAERGLIAFRNVRAMEPLKTPASVINARI